MEEAKHFLSLVLCEEQAVIFTNTAERLAKFRNGVMCIKLLRYRTNTPANYILKWTSA
jgi:hypothetical protein